MSEAVGTEKRNLTSPKGSFREIITKAVCGTAEKSLRYTHYVGPLQDMIPNQILGCSITQLRLHEPEVKDGTADTIAIGIGGVLEVHIWYAFNDGKETDVLRCPVNFEESLPMNDYDCQNTNPLDARIVITNNPQILESTITEDNRIKLEFELGVYAEVIGETKLLVQVYEPGRGRDDD